MRDIFKGEIQLLLPQKRIFYRKRFSYEDVKFTSSFESAFFCYKMNLPQDINYIKDDEETLNICDYLEQMIPLHTSNISNRVLELFKGTGSVGHVANEYGYEVITLDNEAEFEPTHLVDIMEWDYTVYSPGYFKVIHASVPCTTFSQLQHSWVGRKKGNGKIFTDDDLYKDIEEIGLPLLQKTIEIFLYFQPKYWIIENPATGKMKNYSSSLPQHVASYCKSKK